MIAFVNLPFPQPKFSYVLKTKLGIWQLAMIIPVSTRIVFVRELPLSVFAVPDIFLKIRLVSAYSNSGKCDFIHLNKPVHFITIKTLFQ